MGTPPQVVIIGGGLAGLSAGCYALASGFRVRIIEHNLALGGVCTAWTRGPYTIDGCIHWLTGGPFMRLYEELGIVQRTGVRTIERFCVYRDERDDLELEVTRDLAALATAMRAIAPQDSAEIARLVDGAKQFLALEPPVVEAQELQSFRDGLSALWELRHVAGTLVHFRKPLGVWTREHLKSEPLRRLLTTVMPPEAPALTLLFLLGYLHRGWLSRPMGGTTAFRDAIIAEYQRLGGETQLHSTVEEILVEGGRARGVRLGDGTMVEADWVISTASTPETVQRLLGNRYGSDEMARRIEHWKLTPPIVLASFGVELPLEGAPHLLSVGGIEPFDVGGVTNDALHLRLCSDDPVYAPRGHAVIQALLSTSYDWWATRGTRYQAEKDAIAQVALDEIDRRVPGAKQAARVVDVATPLTYWSMARSWRGAFEGWLPNESSMFGHVKKTLHGLGHLILAGQWVEPGGGVPPSIMSGRQAVQILCHEAGRTFATPPRA